MSVPDHASNSSVDSPELITQVGRKRLRSPSMQSDSGASSSSVKRSVADSSTNEIQIRSPRPDQPFSITSTDPNRDIDAYMAEQGEAEIPAFIPSPLSQSDASAQSISRKEKLSRVQTAKGRRMVIGEKWYLVSSRWFKRFTKACTGEIDKEGPVTEQDLGPVNNSSLLDSYDNLLPSLAESVDVEYVPQEVWDLLVEWYVFLVDYFIWGYDVYRQVWHSYPPFAAAYHSQRRVQVARIGTSASTIEGFQVGQSFT